ncbi:hypothetical protein L226DRAFT_474013 [Lentinus tigrinus ALCF2SS1-7]|uniref:DUF6699 domain-containing protein n=1 Tax=Lentinus tigrinus ALCF2SS1-6 TaxID=1328759 RepID=A0A5C2RME2_9APHY|nr:hypothetical protein L227DRAFT_514410 [Lentinus tigrinus ALCF2SS1-6]RPD68031.1 hypothetical protein L226DRAFT_474013 [Lentinus tigrinus ALCF2SS1-7]
MERPPSAPRLSTVPLPSPRRISASINAEVDAQLNSAEIDIELSIDPLLTAPYPPPLRWDVTEHPNNIKLASMGLPQARDLSREDLARCAVRMSANGGPVKLPHITLVFPGLPLMVAIEPIDAPVWTSTPLPYVTVGDVLYSLYKALRLSVPLRELYALTRAHQESVSGVFRQRLARDLKNYDKNIHYGVRYIDYLGKMRQFVGLRPAAGIEVPTGKKRGEVFVVVLFPAH